MPTCSELWNALDTKVTEIDLKWDELGDDGWAVGLGALGMLIGILGEFPSGGSSTVVFGLGVGEFWLGFNSANVHINELELLYEQKRDICKQLRENGCL